MTRLHPCFLYVAPPPPSSPPTLLHTPSPTPALRPVAAQVRKGRSSPL
jgi:hypothetical protein